MARWLKAEFLHCSRIGGFFTLVDLLSGFRVGVGGVVMGFMIGVGSGDGWAGFVAGVGVMGGVGFGLHLVWGESSLKFRESLQVGCGWYFPGRMGIRSFIGLPKTHMAGEIFVVGSGVLLY